MSRFLERRARNSLVRQHDAADCGPACLATVIRYFGGRAELEGLRELTGTSPTGTTLLSLVRAGPSLGLTIDGFEGDCRALQEIDCPCILHVVAEAGAYHFVVCFGYERSEFVIGDPARGVIRLKEADLAAVWTSRALLTVRRRVSFVDRKTRTRAKLHWLLESIRKDARALLLSVLIGALISAFGLAVAIFSQVLLDEILPGRDGLKLSVGLVLVGLFLVLQNAFTAARQLILIRQARAFNNRITRRFIDGLVYLPFQFFASRKAGDLIARLNDTRRLQRFVTYAVGGVAINALMLLTAFVFVISYSATIGLWVLGGLLLLALCSVLSHPKIVGSQIGVMAAHAANESRYVDSVRGIETIKATNSERHFAAAMKATFAAFQDAAYRLGRIGLSFNFAANMSGLVIMIGVLGWGSSMVLDETMKIGALVALIQMTNMLIPAAYGLALSNIELQEASVAFDRIFQFTSLKPEYSETTAQAKAVPVERLDVRGVAFRFAGQTDLIRDATFRLNRGEIVLLIGQTGSGKSTLLRILMRLYQPVRGTVRANGDDWRHIPTDAWRATAAIVPQQIQVFSGSAAENITMGKEGSRVEAFCRAIGLDPVYRSMPHGYETLLGEGGVQLSGGQRRLLGLTRALYRNPKILLVDELTTGLDRQAARLAVGIILKRKQSMATLMVSHRPEFRTIADRTYVLERGVVRPMRLDAVL